MLPVITLVGRPNVGKSTLFNRLTRSRDALVANIASLTRDRQYGEAEWGDQRLLCVDTAGLANNDEGVDIEMVQQSHVAIKEAHLILFLVDCRAGLTAADQSIADLLRISGKPVILVANKIDGGDHNLVTAPFFELGFARLCPITATQGRGIRHLMEQVSSLLQQQYDDDIFGSDPHAALPGIKMAVVGRPNVGKSTLVNRMLGQNRLVVFDMPGTTRDSVYIQYQHDNKPYTLIDTAGIRRRKSVTESLEKFSIVKTLQAIEDANVVILLIDACDGVVDQDLHLMDHVIDAGRALVIAINKWDGLPQEAKQQIKHSLHRRLHFADFAKIHFISALHGTGVGHLYQSIDQAYQSATKRFSTNNLTKILQIAVSDHQPPMVRGHRIKLRYAHPGGHNPPIIVIHGNQTEAVPGHYARYLEKTFRRLLQLQGTPIKLQFRSTDNPYASNKAGGNRNVAVRQKVRKNTVNKINKTNPNPKKGRRRV
ncbi:MAG: GTP-binding protein [Cellvibrionaceae bacterium]|jgi:GTP-binding protein